MSETGHPEDHPVYVKTASEHLLEMDEGFALCDRTIDFYCGVTVLTGTWHDTSCMLVYLSLMPFQLPFSPTDTSSKHKAARSG